MAKNLEILPNTFFYKISISHSNSRNYSFPLLTVLSN